MRRTHAGRSRRARSRPSGASAFGLVLNVVAFVLVCAPSTCCRRGAHVSATLFYVFVYTIWLKPRSPQNIVIGGAAGAVPRSSVGRR